MSMSIVHGNACFLGRTRPVIAPVHVPSALQCIEMSRTQMNLVLPCPQLGDRAAMSAASAFIVLFSDPSNDLQTKYQLSRLLGCLSFLSLAFYFIFLLSVFLSFLFPFSLSFSLSFFALFSLSFRLISVLLSVCSFALCRSFRMLVLFPFLLQRQFQVDICFYKSGSIITISCAYYAIAPPISKHYR